MAIINTLAIASRGRLAGAYAKKTITYATLGWILISSVPPPIPPPPINPPTDFGGQHVGNGGYDEDYLMHSEKEWRIRKDDDEVLAIIKCFMKL